MIPPAGKTLSLLLLFLSAPFSFPTLSCQAQDTPTPPSVSGETTASGTSETPSQKDEILIEDPNEEPDAVELFVEPNQEPLSTPPPEVRQDVQKIRDLSDRDDTRTFSDDTLDLITGVPSNSGYRPSGYFVSSDYMTPGILLSGFTLHNALDFQTTYTSNLFLSKENEEDEILFRVTPILTITNTDEQTGELTGPFSIVLSYEPELNFYNENDILDSTDHYLFSQFGFDFGESRLTLTQEFEQPSGNEEELGLFLDRDIYTTNANAFFNISDKTSVTTNFRYQLRDVKNGFSSSEYQSTTTLNYRITDKLFLGPGLRTTLLDIDGADEEYFEALFTQLTYTPGPKFQINLSGGVEFRQFMGDQGSQDDFKIGYIYEASATYLPFPQTLLYLTGSREFRNSSIFQGNNFNLTEATIGIRQRFVQRLFVTTAFSYENYDFETAGTPLVSFNRNDNIITATIALEIQIAKWWDVQITASHSERDSTIDLNVLGLSGSSNAFDYKVEEVGIKTTMRF